MVGALENQRLRANLGPDLGCWFYETGRFRLTLGFRWPAARARGVISLTQARDQYHDRMLYWSLRWLSPRRNRGVLTIIIDSMGKAKIAWPQWAFQKPKAYDHCHRPRLVLSGTMAHGCCTDFSFMFCEILEQTIACVAAMTGARGGPDVTSHLCVQSDNTTSQATTSQACEVLSGVRLQGLMRDV